MKYINICILIVFLIIMYFKFIKSLEFQIYLFLKYIFFENKQKYIDYKSFIKELCLKKRFIKIHNNCYTLTNNGYRYFLENKDLDYKYTQLFCITTTILLTVISIFNV